MTLVPVQKGEELTTTYIDTLKVTLERRRHLQQTKFFECDCERCQDSEELSTHGSSWKCRKCNKGLIEANIPLSMKSKWSCKNCRFEYSSEVSPSHGLLIKNLIISSLGNKFKAQSSTAEFEKLIK